jgi:hypothetical protein
MRVTLNKIIESPLPAVQKVDTIKRFLSPSIYFMLVNGDVGERQLEDMEKHIRASINKEMKIQTLPLECYPAS